MQLATAEIQEREREYTRCVKAIKALQTKGDCAAWEIGKKLLEIDEFQLYAHRYASFHRFCLEELDYTYNTACNYMSVARLFTRQQVADVGYCKLMLVSKPWVPEIARAEILIKAHTLSCREINALVRRMAIQERARRERYLLTKMRGRKPSVLNKLKNLMGKTYIKDFSTGYCMIPVESDLGIKIRLFEDTIHVSIVDPKKEEPSEQT